MRAILGILGGLAFGFLLIVYLFRGFGQGETGALFRDEAPLPVSYFSTPEMAVRRINGLIEARDWRGLAQFYDLRGSGTSRQQLLDGSFFMSDPNDPTDLRNYLHPFPPGASFYGLRRVADSDIFEVDVIWQMDAPWAKGQKHLTTFLLERHPEGYRLLPERVVTQPLQTDMNQATSNPVPKSSEPDNTDSP